MRLAILGVFGLLLAAPVAAQTANSGSSANSGSQAGALAGSQSGSASTVITNSNAPDSIKTVPAVVAPAIYAGTNPCVVGASVGGSVLGFGIAGGAMWNDKDCQRRNSSVVLYQQGLREAAREVMCDDEVVFAAMARAGTPCAPRAMAGTQPASAPVAPVVSAPAPRPAFNPNSYAGRADCLSAAALQGLPLTACDGTKL